MSSPRDLPYTPFTTTRPRRATPWLTLAISCLLLAGATASHAATGSEKAASPPTSGAKPAQGVLDLNTATEQELVDLPRVGPALAKRIVEYRKQVGTFKSVDELANVKGIGEKMLELLRPLVTVGSRRAADAAGDKKS